ncbi:hypothetical protein NM208_g11004 [Fusarium decemcellulare]|uniref:Uncharacterized protein n=1 Tax=Fusarium decemcellulare TaxID=57161 RepID=A0ACC1RVY0_9HYPO|nr:hypothetical protein NM208_g11004 [Fusarium decemcellulare]
MAVARGYIGTAIDRLVGHSLGLSPETCNYEKQELTIPLTNGITLAADLYKPVNHAPAGTVLVRSPYSRGMMMAIGSARIYASRGYQVLFVSSRGTFGSTGDFDGGFCEAEDGQGVVEWMRQQTWYTGSFATLGMSYSSFTQWALLRDPPADMVAALILVGPHDYAKHIWGTGAFNMQHISWSHTIATQETASLAERYKALNPAKHLRSVVEALPLVEGVHSHFKDSRSAPWLNHAITHPDLTDPSWAPVQHGQALDKANIPILLMTGWHDIFFQQTMEQYERLSQRGCVVALMVGPWTHLEMQNQTTTPLMLKWLERHLAGKPDVDTGSPVQVYVTGTKSSHWLELPKWPPATNSYELYLSSKGSLGNEKPSPDTKPSTFTFNPASPTPVIGGPLMVGGGAVNDTALSARQDVLVFTTEPLSKSLQIMGKPHVKLIHSSDCPSVDILVRLSVVDQQGVSRNITQQYVRLDEAEDIKSIDVVLADTAYAIDRGERIRIMIAGGSFPMYSRNPGTGDFPETTKMLHRARHHIYHGAKGVSQVILPIS